MFLNDCQYGRAELYLDEIEHLDGRLYGRFGLVGVEPAGLDDGVLVVPGDDGVDQSVGASAGRYVDGVVGQCREVASEP